MRDFIWRVKVVNDNPSFLYEVSDVVVFGSYLTDASDLGDVDIAVRLRSRITDNEQRVAREIEQAHKSGRSFSRFIDELTWAQDEVMLARKARKRTVSIQPWYSFVGMEKKEDFRYKVIMGDTDIIAGDLRDSEGRRKAASTPPTIWLAESNFVSECERVLELGSKLSTLGSTPNVLLPKPDPWVQTTYGLDAKPSSWLSPVDRARECWRFHDLR